jgi:hypothetical protein
MEVMLRWRCFCKPISESCQFCKGSGHIDRWLPAYMLGYLKDKTYLILGRRNIQAAVA